MKKKYIRPIVMLIDANIISNVMTGSGGDGSATSEFGGGPVGEDNPGGGSVSSTNGQLIMGTKGSIFTWSDDYDNEYYD